MTQWRLIKTVIEAVTDPRTFCTKLGRPVPEVLAVILTFMGQHQAAVSQQQQQQPQHPQSFPQFSNLQQPQQGVPHQIKTDMNGYIQ